jgi:O-methyltransferase involved in polyketide biosynthesis
VDNDPGVLAHAKALLDGAGGPSSGGTFGGSSLGGSVLGGAGAVLGEAVATGGQVNGPGPVSFVDADLRDVTAVLNGAASTLDFRSPVALIMLGVLGYLTDYGAARSVISQLLSALPAGSYLAIADGVSTDDAINRAQLRYNSRTDAIYDPHPDAYHLRRPDEFASFFDGLDLVEPGVVACAKWKPDRASAGDQGVPVHCGVART